MPRSALHFSAMALRFDTPVPNWRSVIGFCAQMVGKPVTAPEPAAAPLRAAAPLSRLRRVSPLRGTERSVVFLLIAVSRALVGDGISRTA